MLYRCQKSVKSLSGEGSSGNIRYSNRKHQRYFSAGFPHGFLRSHYCRLGIQRVEYGFYKYRINSTFNQCLHLNTVCRTKFIECKRAECGIVYVRTHRAGLVCRSHRTCHKPRLVRIHGSKFVCHFSCYTYSLKIYLTAKMFCMIVRHRHRSGIETVGFNNVRPCMKILTVNFFYYVRARKAKQIIVSFQLPGKFLETFSTEIIFGQSILLYHRTHGSI